MKIQFENRAILKVVPAIREYTISTSELEIVKLEDLPNEKKVIAYTNNANASSILLWDGESYDAIGQWTNTDVVNRIKEIYSN